MVIVVMKTMVRPLPGKNDDSNRFIQRIMMDGQPYQHYYLEHNKLEDGVSIDFMMGDKPCK